MVGYEVYEVEAFLESNKMLSRVALSDGYTLPAYFKLHNSEQYSRKLINLLQKHKWQWVQDDNIWIWDEEYAYIDPQENSNV